MEESEKQQPEVAPQQERSSSSLMPFNRKDRPLPKVGCSWAFYVFLLLLVVLLVVFYVQYKSKMVL